MATDPYNLRHNTQYATKINGIGKIMCKLKCYDVDYERHDGYYILIILEEVIINGIKETLDFHIFPHAYPMVFYDIDQLKENAQRSRQHMEQRALDKILKRLVNEHFTW